MKMIQCEFQKIALAALLLGVFSLSPAAKAEGDPASPQAAAPAPAPAPAAAPSDDVPDAVRKGLTWSELRKLSDNTFKIVVKDGMVNFQGALPAGCMSGRSMSEVDSSDGQHRLMIDMPNCSRGDSSKLTGDAKKMKRVDVAFPAKAFSGEDGKFCMKYSSTGDDNMECDPVMTQVNGKSVQLEHTSQATILERTAAEKAKEDKILADAAAKRADKDRYDQEAALMAKLKVLCANGQFKEFGEEIEALRNTLGDVSKYMGQLEGMKKTFYENAIKKAKSEDLKDAYQNYLTAAEENGWETEEVTKQYIERRRDIVNEMIGSDAGVEKKGQAIREFAKELREMDGYRQNRETVSWLYGQLAVKLRDAENYDDAEKYFGKAVEETASNDTKIKFEDEIKNMFVEAAKACLAKNKGSVGKCDKLAEKANKHMGNKIALQGKLKGDDAADELNASKIERIQMFGMEGYSANVQGYGKVNMSGGLYEQAKREAFQQGRNEMIMQYMMRQSMGGGMGGMNGGFGGFGGGSMFR